MNFLLQKVPRFVLVIVVLAVFGLIRTPFEDHLRDGLVQANLVLPPPGQSAMEQMSQSALIGTLGGLRSLVATYLVLEGYQHFSDKAWEDLARTYNIITALEPRDENHWVAFIWHIGINATANMQIDQRIPEFEADRRFKEYALQAIEIGKRGMKQLPESAAIRTQLAEVYRVKLNDPCSVAELYGEVRHLERAPQYADRFYGYFLAQCPGREREAYDHLLSLYHESEQNHLPSLIATIKDLEKELDIPLIQRIPDPYPKIPGRPPQ